jgi:CIC family chloride channel protein
MNKQILLLATRFSNSQTLILGSAALLVGLTTGMGVWLFKFIIEIIRNFGSTYFQGPMLVFFPVIGGLTVGLISFYFIQPEKFHGTTNIIKSVALTGGRLNYQTTPLKTLAAILSIGTGASVGPEDPSVQIGANFGSMIGQRWHLSDERIRALVAAGAASAIAAAFNAPIAGVFFSLEIILGEMGSNSLGLILVASVTSSVFTQAVSGSSPAFQIPPYDFKSAWELPLYLLLGLAAGPISALYVQFLYRIQDLFKHWSIPGPVKTSFAGLLVGLTGLFLPQIYGVGYETIGEVLNKNDLSLWLLFAMLIAKILLTPVCLGGGFFGGVFAPSLFVGAMLGGAFGSLSALLFPNLHIVPAAFALVGMASVLAGAVHAPLTAVILLFEMTNDYRIILPLMFSVAVSLLVSQRLQKDSVYAMGLARHGIRLDRGRDIEVLSTITVGEVMQPDTDTLPESLSLDEANQILTLSHHHGLPVVDDQNLLSGILTLQDIERSDGKTVGEACTHQVETTFPEESLNTALQKMSRQNVGRLPVVSRQNPRKIKGILRRADIIQAYDIALNRRTTQRHYEQAIHLEAITPNRVDVAEIKLEEGSPLVGKTLSEIHFPDECVIASIQRGVQVIVPKGETQLELGDIVIIVAKGTALQAAKALFLNNQDNITHQ